ncbi:twin-arginine translocation signal domain-containing protein [Nonomuraea sp. NPDC003560]|uniref:twin-arginine translocation signal domain-containing protein n=1 Tax=Nonomuraea sp. NPDC003560 TaxID=3364341 RepID=UPI0036C2E173
MTKGLASADDLVGAAADGGSGEAGQTVVTRRTFLGTATAAGATTLLGGNVLPVARAGTSPSDAAGLRPARDAIRAVNADTRRNYAALKAGLVNHLSPVIVVQNDHRGGLYSLVSNGRVLESLHPVDEIYELAKSIAHLPLGIFTVIAPYLPKQVPAFQSARIDPHDLDMVAFKGPADGWVQPLKDVSATINTARRRLDEAGLPPSLQQSCANILDRSREFIAHTTRSRSFDMDSFEDYSGSVYPNIRTNMYWASKVQIEGVADIMTRWRGQLGDNAWKGLYVVVFTIWTTSSLNQNSLVIKKFMDPAQADTHLIDLSTAELPSEPIPVALDNVARIVQDKIAAEMIFCTDTKLADALKGPDELLSGEILRLLGRAPDAQARPC